MSWAPGLIIVGLGMVALVWLICYGQYLKNKRQYHVPPRRRTSFSVGQDVRKW